jgi:hypothetical protein
VETLPVQRIIIEAAESCWELRGRLARVLIVPGIVFLALNIGAHFVRGDVLWYFLYRFSGELVLALAAVSCHRLLLLGAVSVPDFGTNGGNARDWKFLVAFLGLWITTSLLLMVGGFLANVALAPFGLHVMASEPTWLYAVRLIAWLPGLYLLSRLSMALPAIAIDQPLGFRGAWQLSRGHSWQLLVLVALLPWLVIEFDKAIAALLPAAPFAPDLASSVLVSVLFLLLLPLEIAVLSLSFRHLAR